ncbi:hypothetical protein ACIQ9R_05730 [Streptomyces sp. NPDC094447]|uniref:hypothetical protein n=1 Tax=unclassified Streptomyces TaxID=2593676 RepID=UPI003827BC38
MKVKYGVITAAMLVAAGGAWAGANGTATTQNESATPSVTLTGEPIAPPAAPEPTVPVATRSLHSS